MPSPHVPRGTWKNVYSVLLDATPGYVRWETYEATTGLRRTSSRAALVRALQELGRSHDYHVGIRDKDGIWVGPHMA